MYNAEKVISESFPILEAEAPKGAKGIYLLGSCYFNPYTDEHFYWIKVGMTSTSFCKRMKQYYSHSPMVFTIGYQIFDDNIISDMEIYYHEILKEKFQKNARCTTEWFLVSKEDYLKICKEGFDYFV